MSRVCTTCKRDDVEFKPKYAICTGCKSKSDRKRYLKSKPTIKHKVKEYQQLNKDKVKEWNRKRGLKRKYNITLEEYSYLFDQQMGLCAICGKSSTNKLLAVDHDHNTGRIRGLLCDACNLALGKFKDDPDILLAALIYLTGDGAVW